MDECIDSLREARMFSVLEINSGYCLIEIDDKDVEIFAGVRQ